MLMQTETLPQCLPVSVGSRCSLWQDLKMRCYLHIPAADVYSYLTEKEHGLQMNVIDYQFFFLFLL